MTWTSTAPTAAPHREKTAIEMTSVTKVYGDRENPVTALNDVSLRIPTGSFTAIVGPSGSGKSTLLHCGAALDSPTSGTIRIAGTDLTGLSETKRTLLRRDLIGFVFQAYNLVPSLTIGQNITLPARLAGSGIDRDRLAMLVERVGLTDRLNHLPGQLSGGQQQRAAIVRALATDPAVVFADEPTGALDLKTGHEVLRLLRNLVDDLGQTVVMVTHDPSAAARAHRSVVMANGSITKVLDAPTAAQLSYELINQEDQ